MATNQTFTMIKPDAVQDNHIGGITQMIEAGGFRIVSLKKTKLKSFLINFQMGTWEYLKSMKKS